MVKNERIEYNVLPSQIDDTTPNLRVTMDYDSLLGSLLKFGIMQPILCCKDELGIIYTKNGDSRLQIARDVEHGLIINQTTEKPYTLKDIDWKILLSDEPRPNSIDFRIIKINANISKPYTPTEIGNAVYANMSDLSKIKHGKTYEELSEIQQKEIKDEAFNLLKGVYSFDYIDRAFKTSRKQGHNKIGGKLEKAIKNGTITDGNIQTEISRLEDSPQTDEVIMIIAEKDYPPNLKSTDIRSVLEFLRRGYIAKTLTIDEYPEAFRNRLSIQSKYTNIHVMNILKELKDKTKEYGRSKNMTPSEVVIYALEKLLN